MRLFKGKFSRVIINVILVTTLILMLMPQLAQAADPVVDLVLLSDNSSLVVQTSFDITIQAQCGSQPVAGISAFLDFDPNYLEVTGVTPGTVLPTVLQNAVSNPVGHVDYSAGLALSDTESPVGPNGTFTLATIHFRTMNSVIISTSVNFHTNTGDPPIRDTRAVAAGGATVTRNLTPATVTIISVDHLAASGPSSIMAGESFIFTITAKDAGNNTAAGYRGTVHFSSSDLQFAITSPTLTDNNYTFTETDAGAHTFTAILKTAGVQTIAAVDASGQSTSSPLQVTVGAASATALEYSGFPSTTAAGMTNFFTVTAKDAYGNVATGYAGTVTVTSNDNQATITPANHLFVPGTDHGAFNFSVTLRTAGTNKSITASDGTRATIQDAITVTPGNAAVLVVSGITSPRNAGVFGNVTVEGRDVFGNRATGYTGIIHFTSTDAAATKPADYTFTSGIVADNGIHTFTGGVIFITSGTWSITATDTVNTSITGSQSGIVVLTPPTGGDGGGGGGGGSTYNTVSVSGLTAGGNFKVNGEGLIQSAVQLKTEDGKVTLDIASGTTLKKDKFDPVTSLTANVLSTPPAPPEKECHCSGLQIRSGWGYL